VADNEENAIELIEINLMFARMELSIGKCDESSTARALCHIEEALRHVREQALNEQQGCNLAPQSPHV
jgi:hypothetical protein